MRSFKVRAKLSYWCLFSWEKSGWGSIMGYFEPLISEQTCFKDLE